LILIHTALLCEAQTFIERYKLKKINSTPKIYKNDRYIVVISGIGKDNTIRSLEYVFNNYKIVKAINIGIAGVSNKTIKIGELFCCNKKIENIKRLPLITANQVQTIDKIDQSKAILYDMEASYFLDISLRYLNSEYIIILKVVSDYLSDEILPKDFIKGLISKGIRCDAIKELKKG
jgi:nucleoside phosphorylase